MRVFGNFQGKNALTMQVFDNFHGKNKSLYIYVLFADLIKGSICANKFKNIYT